MLDLKEASVSFSEFIQLSRMALISCEICWGVGGGGRGRGGSWLGEWGILYVQWGSGHRLEARVEPRSG